MPAYQYLQILGCILLAMAFIMLLAAGLATLSARRFLLDSQPVVAEVVSLTLKPPKGRSGPIWVAELRTTLPDGRRVTANWHDPSGLRRSMALTEGMQILARYAAGRPPRIRPDYPAVIWGWTRFFFGFSGVLGTLSVPFFVAALGLRARTLSGPSDQATPPTSAP